MRVRPSIKEPRYTFGPRVNHSSIGNVRSLDPPKLFVDFPNHKSWIGVIKEMEVVGDTTTTTTTTTTTSTTTTAITPTISISIN